MKRILGLLYGVVCYLIFFGTFLYAIGFVGNMIVPKGIDSDPTAPFAAAFLMDTLLLGIFAVQHSVMARQGFKAVWTKIVPKPLERSTYVLFSSLALLLLFWKWEPMGGVVWAVQGDTLKGILQIVSLLGWFIVLISTFLINHFDLFGLRQTFLYFQGKDYKALPFKTPGFYRLVRHPIYFGFVVAFWSTPTMTVTHLVFAAATTGYILIGIQLEEKDLISFYGDVYRQYKKKVSMIIPLPPK